MGYGEEAEILKLVLRFGVVQSSDISLQDSLSLIWHREDNEGSESAKKSWNPFPIFLKVPAFFSYGKVNTL